ncbi:MAG TPA: YdcF family protein [Luteibacter sp.]|uniref:YdcF family protein n=1 Tax=Luteibacter sp. TaxID=1886636 RepID=UPI002CD94CE1|nr:YdcF family protein [Luteibacter sp.]HVI55740.1 YdcF family protein [Luteibacter sp.]
MSVAVDIVGRLTHPAIQGLLLALLSTALVLWRRPRAAALAAALAVAWIWTASTPLLALHLREGLATVAAPSTPHAEAIVVLGGGKLPGADWSRTTTRAGRGLTLWRDGFAPLLLVSGVDQADELAHGFALSGVPSGDLRVERSSLNTHENARNSAAILRADGLSDILLVTSAIHMRRAAGCFRHEGIEVSPVPADDGHAALALAPAWFPRRDALTLTARCLREYLALMVYRWRGWM